MKVHVRDVIKINKVLNMNVSGQILESVLYKSKVLFLKNKTKQNTVVSQFHFASNLRWYFNYAMDKNDRKERTSVEAQGLYKLENVTDPPSEPRNS